MITNNRGTSFWGRPTPFITPGDVFPGIPFVSAPHPLQLLKKSPISPKAGHRPYFNLFDNASESEIANIDVTKSGQHEMLGQGRVSKALFLSWGSEVEDDLRNYEQSGRPGGRTWLAAPILEIAELSDSRNIPDAQTGELKSMQEMVSLNRTYHCFHLKPLPDANPGSLGWYVDFKRISAIRISHFVAQKDGRMATLMGDTRNELYQHLMLFFTRARLFLGSVRCEQCSAAVSIETAIEDQNVEAEAWS